MNLILIINILPLVILQTLYCTYFLYQIKVQKDLAPSAIFERSLSLLLFANTTNYLESILNIVQGMLYLNNDREVTPEQVIILFSLIYLSRYYSSCMVLRMLRFLFLNRYRNGKINKKTLNRVSSIKFLILITNSYSILILVIICFLVYILDLPQVYLSYLNNFCFIYESIFFLVMSNVEMRMNSHPTLCAEYFIYSIVWFSGSFSSIKHLDFRWLVEAPIRNNMLLFISWFSIKRHLEYVRPPLPFEIEIFHVFQIKELYDDFKEFLENSDNEDLKSACSVMAEISRASFYGQYENLDLHLNSSQFDAEVEDLLNNKKFTRAKQRASDCLSDAFKSYKDSQKFSQFKRNYDVMFN